MILNLKKILLLTFFIMITVITIAKPRVRPENWAKQIIGSNLDNFYRVDKKLYRSDQPDEKSFKQLKELGIKSVLNLRNHHSDDDEAKKMEIKLYRLKMNAGSIDEKQVYEALKIIKNAEKPILIHCWHGSDRTGTVVAAYRMVFQNWSRKDAIDEFKNGGYGYHKKIYPNLEKLLEKIDIDKLKKRVDINN